MMPHSFSSIPRSNVTLQNVSLSLANAFTDQVTQEEVKGLLRESIAVLQKGVVFTKYGTGDYFKGSKRLLFLNKDIRLLCWSKQLEGNNVLPQTSRLVESQ